MTAHKLEVITASAEDTVGFARCTGCDWESPYYWDLPEEQTDLMADYADHTREEQGA